MIIHDYTGQSMSSDPYQRLGQGLFKDRKCPFTRDEINREIALAMQGC